MAQGGQGGMPISGTPGYGKIPNNMQPPGQMQSGRGQQPNMGHGATQFGPATPGGGGYDMRQPPVYGGQPPMSLEAQQWMQMVMQGQSPDQFMRAFGGGQGAPQAPQVGGMSPAQGSIGFTPPGTDFLQRSMQRGL